MKASELFLKTASKLGVENVFGIVGGEAQFIQFDEEKQLNFYLTRHEFAAGIMADVYGRVTGVPQICYSTFGPGLTNLSTGVFSAMQDRSPVLVVSAQIPRSEIRFNQTHQCLDNVSFIKTISKYATEIERVQDIPNIVRKAMTIATEGIPGPVYISFPVDVMQQELDDEKAEQLLASLQPIEREKSDVLNRNDLEKLLHKLEKANNPLIIAGNQIIREGCSESFQKFVEKHNIPVITTLASKGVIPEDHPLSITPCNKYIDKIYQQKLLSNIFDNCDLILLMGYDFGEDLKSSLWKADTETLLINSFYVDMGDVFQPSQTFLGDFHHTLDALSQANMPAKADNYPMLEVKKIFDKREANVNEGTSNIPQIIKSARNALGKTGILCSDIGLHKQYAGLLSKTYVPNTFMCSNVCGTFGFGLPAGLGAKLAKPDERVCIICGDGGFHSTSQDLETAIRYDIPVVIIILKDNAFGLIKYYQFLNREEAFTPSVEFGEVDFVKLAEANGMKGVHLENIDDLEDVINTAFLANEPLLIEIPIVYDYRLKGTEMETLAVSEHE